MGRILGVVAIGILGLLGFFLFRGYEVEELGSDTDMRLKALTEGQTFTLSELTDTDCSEVGIVGAYAANSARNRVVGRAEVSMTYTDLFVLLVAFDEEGNRLQATRLSRVPYDLNFMGPSRFSCSDEFVASEGEVLFAS